MSFDQHWAYRDDLQEKYGQQAEGGPNHNNNCVPATFSNIMHAYGYLHTQPQWWVTGEYPLNFLGPTSYAAMIDWIKKNSIGAGADFPNPPEVRVSNPVDTVAAVEAAGAAGYAVAFNAWSDGSGNYQMHPTGILHVGAVLQHDSDASGPFVVVLNPEHNTPQRFAEADFRAMTSGADAGWLAVFVRPLPAPPVVAPPVVPPPLVDYKALWESRLAQLEVYKASLTAKDAALVDLQGKLVDAALELTTMRGKVVDVTAANGELTAQAAGLQAQNEQLGRQLATMTQEVASLHNSAATLLADDQTKASQLVQYHEIVTRQAARITELQTELAQALSPSPPWYDLGALLRRLTGGK